MRVALMMFSMSHLVFEGSESVGALIMDLFPPLFQRTPSIPLATKMVAGPAERYSSTNL